MLTRTVRFWANKDNHPLFLGWYPISSTLNLFNPCWHFPLHSVPDSISQHCSPNGRQDWNLTVRGIGPLRKNQGINDLFSYLTPRRRNVEFIVITSGGISSGLRILAWSTSPSNTFRFCLTCLPDRSSADLKSVGDAGLATTVNASDLRDFVVWRVETSDLADQYMCALRRHVVKRSSRSRGESVQRHYLRHCCCVIKCQGNGWNPCSFFSIANVGQSTKSHMLQSHRSANRNRQ